MKRRKLPPIPPNVILVEEFMRPERLTIEQLAKDLGVKPSWMAKIVNGHLPITEEVAVMFYKKWNVSVGFWLKLQRDYDIRAASFYPTKPKPTSK